MEQLHDFADLGVEHASELFGFAKVDAIDFGHSLRGRCAPRVLDGAMEHGTQLVGQIGTNIERRIVDSPVQIDHHRELIDRFELLVQRRGDAIASQARVQMADGDIHTGCAKDEFAANLIVDQLGVNLKLQD